MPIETVATDYGYRSTLGDPLGAGECQLWVYDVMAAVAGRSTFGQLIDLRACHFADDDPEVEGLLRQTMRAVRAQGLLRSAVVVADSLVASALRQLVAGTDVDEWERYLDGSDPWWEAMAVEWLRRGLDPDQWVVADAG